MIRACARLALMVAVLGSAARADEIPEQLKVWLGPQTWERDTPGPILSLGEPGAFDDTHLFAPAIGVENGRFLLWYCGSTGFAWDLAPTRQRDERVFKLGLAESADGIRFEKRPGGPVLDWGDGKRSILTPGPLRNPDGTLLREEGQLRMWFTAADFSGNRRHTIHESTSADGIHWSAPSASQIDNAYCPTVIKEGSRYRMWYADVTRFPWFIAHAESADGRAWQVSEKPAIEPSQPWEHRLTIYPTVLKADGVYLMWYGSYTEQDRSETAIGFAVSLDGITWHKHPENPVLRSDPARPWESHYVTSESVARLADGSFRIWYASRKAPPFHNLYFAINTARWTGPKATAKADLSPAAPDSQ